MSYDVYISRGSLVPRANAMDAWSSSSSPAPDEDYQENLAMRLEQIGFTRQHTDWDAVAEALDLTAEEARLLTAVSVFHEPLSIDGAITSRGIELHLRWTADPEFRSSAAATVWSAFTTAHEVEAAFMFDPQSDRIFELADGPAAWTAGYNRVTDETLRFIESDEFARRVSSAIESLRPDA